MLDQLGKYVADADRRLDVGQLHHLLAHLNHLRGVRRGELADAREIVHQSDPLLQTLHARVVLRSDADSLQQVLHRLAQRAAGLFVVAVLVNLHLGARVVEGGELLVRLGLAVKLDDAPHDLLVVVPVQALQVVPGEHVDVRLPRRAGEEDDLLGVAALQEALHGLELVPSLRELLAGQLEGSLLLAQRRHPLQDVRPEGLVLAVFLRRHPLRHVLRDVHVVLHAEVHGPLVLVRHRQEVHRLVMLAVLHEELGALSQVLGVAVGGQVVGDLPQRVEQPGLETYLEGALLVAGFDIQDDCLGRLPALLVILRGLRHVGGVRGQRQAHEVAVEVVLLSQAQGVGGPARHLEEVDRFLHPALVLQVPRHVVARRRILGLLADLLRVVQVPVEARHAA
mmetsp:Transcript_57732/g.175860  ORF Transcript_57732/g.175860 Transcript_57732/m.175860 type:complete len:395 (-) Transcript_57732:115-1299(-)